MASEPPSPKQQRKIIHDIQAKHETMNPGESYYLVANRWWNLWKESVNFDAKDDGDVPPSKAVLGAIENAELIDGDKLKAFLQEGQDYALLPAEAWEQLHKWYNGGPPLKRYVIEEGEARRTRVEVYLFPVKLVRTDKNGLPQPSSELDTQFSKLATLAQVRAWACERWKLDENKVRVWSTPGSSGGDLLGETNKSLEDLRLSEGQRLLFEVQLADGTWPRGAVGQQREHSGSDAKQKKEKKGFFGSIFGIGSNNQSNGSSGGSEKDKGASGKENEQQVAPRYPRGTCGLENLGNTCFMNSALQGLAHTAPLVEYFLAGKYKADINKANPLGMKGQLADQYGQLLKELWSGRWTSVAPKDLKWMIGKFAPQFNGYQQHDSQELLAFLLDGLHEDLNRITKKPYVEVKESDGRDDRVVAEEQWKGHLLRNQSIIVDLFQGQLKSTIRCPECPKISITFDPFMFLSLPLPVDTTRAFELVLARLDRSKMPLRYSFKLPKTGRVADLKAAIATATNVRADQWQTVEVHAHKIYSELTDQKQLSSINTGDTIFAFERPMPQPAPQDIVEVQVMHRVDCPEAGSGSSTISIYYRPPLKLFGYPFMMFLPRTITGKELYQQAWAAIKRYMKFTVDASVTEAPHASQPVTNGKAKDGDESSDLNPFPFRLKVVNQGGLNCGLCNMLTKNCTGCEVKYKDQPLNLKRDTLSLVIHLSVQQHQEFYVVGEAESVMLDESTIRNRKPPPQKGLTLADCLKCFTVNEKLGQNDLWYCPACKTHRQAFKKFDLWKLPEVLAIHLKRFQFTAWYRDKLGMYVDFPLHDLDLSQFVLNTDEQGTLYDLFAVSNHMGGLGGGHYTAFAKNHEDGRWYHFNDSSCRPVPDSDVRSEHAYVLFYQRKKKSSSQNGTSTPPAVSPSSSTTSTNTNSMSSASSVTTPH